MTANDGAPRPTSTELDILRILWEQGPSTVRQVHEVMSAEKPIGYTGVLKFLQIMTAKGSVVRDEGPRAHVYKPAAEAAATRRRAAGDLLRKVFAGSASQLVLHTIQDARSSPEDIAEIRRVLDDYERGRAG